MNFESELDTSIALFNKLKSYFESPMKSLRDLDGDILEFIGDYGGNKGNKTVFQGALGYAVPFDILEFINIFGGTTLFVDCYGLGLAVFEMDSIPERNLALQKSTDPFWSKFAMVAENTGNGDFLCLYYDDKDCHFGILDHEAWGEPEVWALEAIIFCHFDKWLKYFVLTNGEIIPPKDARYNINFQH